MDIRSRRLERLFKCIAPCLYPASRWGSIIRAAASSARSLSARSGDLALARVALYMDLRGRSLESLSDGATAAR